MLEFTLGTVLFIKFRWLDFFDIVIVALLIFQLYKLVRGTVAINIFFGIIAIYTMWLVVKALNMRLLESILGQFISVGVIALMIVFQQELRRFLLLIGTSSIITQVKNNKIFSKVKIGFKENYIPDIDTIVESCASLSKSKTGALIVLEKESPLNSFIETGEKINANITKQLLISIFQKNSPLHDGAVIIVKHKIVAVKCILPVSETSNLPDDFGMRHRAGLGISEISDAICIIVSEQTGKITIAQKSRFQKNIDLETLKKILLKEYNN